MSSDGTGNGGTSRLRIEAKNVSKVFRLGELASLGNTASYVSSRLRGRRPDWPRMEALSEISFEVAAGECFAIIGTNGSGKSTLAKTVAGITLPTSGEILTRGRVLPLLMVGAGFAMDLTGRENVTLFGNLLGLSRRESLEAIPRIVEFAEIDEAHMGTPLKRFSPGEQARLSFATALQLPADVFLFDEVLNVADDEFKAKCIAEIRHLLNKGATVVFISHELNLVRSVATRGIWIDKSRLKLAAPIDELASAYAASHPQAAYAS